MKEYQFNYIDQRGLNKTITISAKNKAQAKRLLNLHIKTCRGLLYH